MHAHRGFLMPKNRKYLPMDMALKILVWLAALYLAVGLCWFTLIVFSFGKELLDEFQEERKHRKP